MKIAELIEKVNNPNVKFADVAKELNVNPSTLRRNLNKVGYQADKTDGLYKFQGNESDKNTIDDKELSDFKNNPSVKQSNKTQDKIIKKSDKNKIENEFPFDEKEIRFLKRLYNRSVSQASKFTLAYDFSNLPDKEKTKKHQMEISETTLKNFEDFAEKLKGKRYSKNDLIEMALVRFIRDFEDLTY